MPTIGDSNNRADRKFVDAQTRSFGIKPLN
jgi:hypothetical protein